MGARRETIGGAHFVSLADPGADREQDHLLLDIVTVALCAVICGTACRVGEDLRADEGHTAADVPRPAGRYPVP